MIGKLFGRGEGEGSRRNKDKAIVHESVPEEVLFPEGRRTSEADTSWMDDVLPETAEPSAAKAAQAAASPAPAPRAAARSEPASPPSPTEEPAPISIPQGVANARASGRPRFPVGWLAVIEGPDTGEWYPLEGGISTLGSQGEDTIPLANGGAQVVFDNAQNTFAIAPNGDATVRLNGIALQGAVRLRDGDVIGVEGAALKLVALCTGNFRWSDLDRKS